MAVRTMKNSGVKMRVARSTAVAAIAAVGLVGVSATAAQAESQILGVNRRTAAEAQKDLPGLQRECTNKGGRVNAAEVHTYSLDGTILYYGYVRCSV
ncbi:hypothetical protein [Streptomyces griseorubiginosus]|uniref:hypothetical protein n=1 Tax=Streptomyces griseorubiginosus TaxID=67304 RepID=UPI00076DABC4|nr:hypothetical protein [Streptomyces griseorubiginosus]KUM68140.1 hypothetical protein AQI84_39070 [Streptomyces griseorubiginosus]